jgi:hypothetical protein
MDLGDEPLNITVTDEVVSDASSGWACVVIPGSAAMIGTGKAVKISGTVDGHRFDATLLPIGHGAHMVPIKAALRKSLGKEIGDTVTVHIDSRRT